MVLADIQRLFLILNLAQDNLCDISIWAKLMIAVFMFLEDLYEIYCADT